MAGTNVNYRDSLERVASLNAAILENSRVIPVVFAGRSIYIARDRSRRKHNLETRNFSIFAPNDHDSIDNRPARLDQWSSCLIEPVRAFIQPPILDNRSVDAQNPYKTR